MAVAFVVLAAVPSVAADGESAVETETVKVKVGESYIIQKEDKSYALASSESDTPFEFETLKDAFDAINNNTWNGEIVVECPANSAINFYSTGSHDLTVKKSVTIEGNGSYAMSNGKYGGHFTVDTFKDYLTADKETKLVIKGLNDFGVWGQRTTADATFTLEMEGCNIGTDGRTLSDGNGKAVYLSGANGVNNISLKNCKFGANASHCTVYSKAPGSVTVENCTFTNISEPININSKAASGEEISVSVKGCTFTDCGLGTVACKEGESMDGWTTDKSWSAPIRLVNSGGADMSAAVENCTFTYTGSNAPVNGDILVGEGRDKQVKNSVEVALTSEPVKLDVKGTAAQIQWQSTGYYAVISETQSNPADAAKQLAIDAQKDAVIGSDGSEITVSAGSAAVSGTVPAGMTVEVAKDAALNVSKDTELAIPANAKLTGEGKISVSGKLENQGTVTATVTVSEGGSVTGEVPTVYDTMRTVYIGNGSEITGTNYGPEQRVEVVGNATIVGDMVVEGLLYVNKDAVLTIEEGGSLTIKGANVSVVEGSLVLLEGANLEINQNAVLNIVGSMSVEGDVTVENNAQIVFKQGADANIGGKLTATAKVVIEDSATLTLSGAVAADTVFDVAGTLNIDSRDAVSGSFEINLDKGTVDIANVVLGVTGKDAAITGQKDNSGKATITVTDKGTVIYDKTDKDVTAEVTQPSAKNNDVTIAGEVITSFDKKDGSTEETSYDAGARVSGVKVVSELKVTKIAVKDNKGTKTAYDGTVYDKAYNDYHEHAYTMTVSGAMSQAGEVFYEGTDATIDVASSIATISVDGKTSAKIGETSVGNWMSLTASDNVAVSGALSLAPRTNTTATDGEKSNAASATFDGETAVEAAVTVGAGASITFDGETSVKASIDATAAVSSVKAQAVLGTNGKIVVSENGSIAVVGGITPDTGVTITSLVKTDDGTTGYLSAAVYTVGTTNPVTYYVDVDAAIAAMAAGTTDRVSVYGTQTVDASASILANDTLTLEADSVLVVGSEDDGEDVVLTLEKDSALKTKAPAEAQVVVNGTLHAVNKKNVQSTLLGEGVISSEVYSCETDDKGAPVSSGWAEWTNLNNALKNAEAGETIQVMKNADIEGTIKEGVTVKSGENVLTVKQKKTLNVAGVLDITGGTLFIEKASKNITTNAIETAAGAVVLTGRIVLGDFDFTENDEPTNVVMGNEVGSAEFYAIAGAYYRIDGAMEISTPAYVAGKIASVEEQTVAIISVVDARDNAIADEDETLGTVDLGEIAFTGKSADEPATVGVFANLTAAGITLENASIVIIDDEEYDVTIDATFKGAESSVAIVGKVSDGRFTVSEGAFGESVEHALMVSGEIGDIDSTKKSDSSMKIEGTVYAIPGSEIAVDSVAVSGTLVVAKTEAPTDADKVEIAALSVSGTLEVKDGAKLNVPGTLKIAGDASVKDGSEISVKTLEVSGALVIVEGKVAVSDVATVTGTVDAAALNEEKSNYVAFFSAAKLYIGTDSKTVGAAASVTGNVSAGIYAVVAAGATAPAVFTGEDAFLASKKYVSTAFTVDDAAYMTVYAGENNTTAINGFKAAKDETLFAGWYYKDSKGVEKAVSDDTYIGNATVPEVYAKFIDGIYKISIEADGGVAYVTVDGKLMSKEDGKFVFKGLAAGTHKIEISAAAGYDVSKTALYNSDGTAVGSMSIVLSDGKDADLGSDGTVVYNVVSYQLIGSTVAVEPTPEPTPIIIKDDKDDMSLTDILLIVLVVLIVIMAAIVALRMMRS